MVTDEQINCINNNLDILDLQEIEKKMHVYNLAQQLNDEGYVYDSKEKKYVKDIAESLDYQKLLEMNVSESFILDFIEKYK